MSKLNLTEKELSYLAGLIDGEGSIGCYKNGNNSIVIKLSFGHTSKLLLDWFTVKLSDFGNVYWRESQRKNWKPAWHWVSQARKAEVILRATRKYLVIKGEQADLALAVLDATPKQLTLMTEERRNFYSFAMNKSKELNAKGINLSN